MVLRKRIFAGLSTGLLPLLSASLSHALVIQPVQVKSAIGEPFYAEIAISDLGASNLQDISVGLANPQELSGLGIKIGNAPNLNFSVQPRSSSQGVIIVSGTQPVNDPFLEFVLRVKSGSNIRLQRVSALLDPKDNKKTALALAPKTQVVTEGGFVNLATSNSATLPPDMQQASRATSKLDTTEQPLAVISNMPPSMDDTSSATLTYTPPANKANVPTTVPVVKEIEVSTEKKQQQRHVVKNNESLWKIAKQLEPQMNQSVDQIMKTIRDMNKDAFIAGNPNQLRRGATLILPERDQNTTLVNRALPAPLDHKKVVKSNLNETTTQTRRSGILPKAELTIIAPTANGIALGNSTKGRTTGSQPLSRELALKLGQERRKTVSMQHEVSELNAQLTLNDKKIAMLNAKLAEMEQQLKNRKQKQKTTKQASTQQKVVNAFAPVIAVAALALAGFSPNLAYAAEGEGGGFPIWIIPVVILVIAIIAKVMHDKSGANAKNKRNAKGKNKRPTSRPATTQRTDTPATTSQARPVSAPQVPVERKTPTPATDVLQDAQSYIDRERYTQAIGILKQAIDQSPQRIDLQIKMLEVYALQNDAVAFDKQHIVVTNFNQAEASAHADKLKQLLHVVPEKPSSHINLEDGLEFSPSFSKQDLVEPLDTSSEEFFPDALQDTTPKSTPSSATDDVDQSLAALEAEFGFGQEPTAFSPATAPAAPSKPAAQQANRIDFSLDDFKPETKATPEETSIDLEFDVSDSFTVEEIKAFDNEPQSLGFKQDVPPAAPPAAPVVETNLDGMTLEETNWAEGFDDLDFSLEETPASAAPVAAPVIEPSQPIAAETIAASNDPDDFLLKEFPFLVNIDVQQTNLELAESYINLGEARSARELLNEVVSLGTSQQKAQAQYLMQNLPS